MQNCTLSLSRYDLGVVSWIYSCFQELSWWMDSPNFRFVDLCGPSGLSLSKQDLAASDQQGVPLAGRLLWFFSRTYLLRPVFLWRTVLGSGSHEGGLQPQWASLAGSYSSAFWQTSLSHLTGHPKQRPEENNQSIKIRVSALSLEMQIHHVLPLYALAEAPWEDCLEQVEEKQTGSSLLVCKVSVYPPDI